MNGLKLFSAFVFLFLGIQNLNAQSYPAKPVRVVISFIAGSSTDIVGRITMQKLSEYWGQPVVAENRAGAGGSIGSREVAGGGPGGDTLCVNSSLPAPHPPSY